jgi:hypothetical protein
MVDLSQTDTFDDWFFHSDEPVIPDVHQSSSSSSSSSSLPSSPVLSSNESTLPITKMSSLSNNEEENQIKKRKHEEKIDLNENKKSKQTPAYMRRNIRHLFTNDKLQNDTISALKAEQDRLKRLEEINNNYQQYNTIYTYLSTNNPQQIPANEEECIVLDDEENESENLSLLKINSGRRIKRKNSILIDHLDTTERRTNNDDDDVQCVDDDDDTELVNDTLTKKLQRLHIDDRVNIPDENGNKKSRSTLYFLDI